MRKLLKPIGLSKRKHKISSLSKNNKMPNKNINIDNLELGPKKQPLAQGRKLCRRYNTRRS